MTIVIDVGSFFKFFGYFMLAVAAYWFIYIIYKIAEHLFLETIQGIKETIKSIKWAVLHPVEFLKLTKSWFLFMLFLLLGIGLYLGLAFGLAMGAAWVAVRILGPDVLDSYFIFIMVWAFFFICAVLYDSGLWNKIFGDDEKLEEVDD